MRKKLVSVICLCFIMTLAGCDSSIGMDTASGATELVPQESSEDDTKSTDEAESDSTADSSESTIEGDFVFSSQDIYGEKVSSDIFTEYELTLVNVFATWCPPCIAELPELASVYNEMEEKGVNAMGFVVDARGIDGELDEDALKAAKTLYEDNNVKYKMVLPDETFVNGMLLTEAVPTTYFVDSKGQMVGEPVVGANDYEGWKSIIEERLEML